MITTDTVPINEALNILKRKLALIDETILSARDWLQAIEGTIEREQVDYTILCDIILYYYILL